MAIVTKTRTYNVGDSLTAAYYNQDRDEIIAGVNSINDAQIASSAGILESKIAFNGSGHGHTGGADGKKIDMGTGLSVSGLTAGELIKVNSTGTGLESTSNPAVQERAYVFYVATDLTVANDVSANIPVVKDCTAIKLYAYVKTASVGADIILFIKSVGGTTIATLTIPAGSNSANTTVITGPNLSEGTYLKLDITQIGIATAGSKLTVTLNTST